MVGTVVATLLALAGFLVLWAALVSGPLLPHLDGTVVVWIAGHRSALLTTVMVGVTNVGSPTAMIAILVVVVAVLGWRHRSWVPVARGLGGLAAVLVLDIGIKYLVARPRPPLALRAVAAGTFSFPSGHALVSAGVVLLILWLVIGPGGHLRIVPGTAVVCFVLAVGVSRVVLGVHYPSDVLAGWCLAVVAVGTTVVVALVTDRRRSRVSSARGTPGVVL